MTRTHFQDASVAGTGASPDRQALSQADSHPHRKVAGADETRLPPSTFRHPTNQLGRFVP